MVVKDMRDRKGMSQTQFARVLDVCKSTISLYENGYRRPDKQAIKTYLKLFQQATEDERVVLREWLTS